MFVMNALVPEMLVFDLEPQHIAVKRQAPLQVADEHLRRICLPFCRSMAAN